MTLLNHHAIGALLALCALASSAAPGRGEDQLPVATLAVRGAAIRAEVATAPQDLMHGLARRASLAPDAGMLFVFPRPDIQCMWMRDTPLPLSVAFMDAYGMILNTADMRPNSDEPHCSARRASYALEVPQGLFARRGIRAGDRISGIPGHGSASQRAVQATPRVLPRPEAAAIPGQTILSD